MSAWTSSRDALALHGCSFENDIFFYLQKNVINIHHIHHEWMVIYLPISFYS